MTPEVEALLREREGYVRRGLDSRVAAVDQQLKAAGHRRANLHAGPERAVNTPPERRTRPRRVGSTDDRA